MSVHLHHCFYGISDEVCNHHGSCAEVGAHGDVRVAEAVYADAFHAGKLYIMVEAIAYGL